MSKQDYILTTERLRELLDYNPETGEFHWRVNRSNVKAGTKTGCRTRNGYLFVRVCHKAHLAHRLAWLHFYGEYPPPLIDHINGVKTDNRITNLRPASKIENGQNRKSAQANNKSSGLLGVAWLEHIQKYTAYINANGYRRYLGVFVTKEEAHAAYLEAKRELHPGCTI